METIHKSPKSKIKKIQISHLESIVAKAREAQEKGDITSIWKMIRNISGRKRRQDMPLKNEAGKLCVTEQMEEEELIIFLTTQFGATENLGENEPHEHLNGITESDAVHIHAATTVAMMRKLNIHKAIPH